MGRGGLEIEYTMKPEVQTREESRQNIGKAAAVQRKNRRWKHIQ
jgi:hypothetical protein